MKKIILDTNFLMIPFSLKVDIFRELERILEEPYEICVLEGSLRELDHILASQKGKDRDAAKFALAMVKAKKIAMLSSRQHVDDELVAWAGKGAIIATQDAELKRRVRGKGGLILLRQKRYLMRE